MLTHVGVFAVDFSRIDTGKTVCFLVSGGLFFADFAVFVEKHLDKLSYPRYNTPVSHVNDS